MTTKFLAPDPAQSTFFIPGTNTPGNGVLLFTYLAGTNTKETAYKDNAGASSWTNPIVLDSGGNLPSGATIWLTQGLSYKLVWAPSNDSDPPLSPYRTIDNVAGINDITLTSTGEWVSGSTPTFVGASQFSLVGDQTATYHVGRRVKFTVTAGTVYGSIRAVSFGGGVTTVTMTMDSTSLDSGLSTLFYALLDSVNPSVPTPRTNVFRIADSTDPLKQLSVVVSSFAASTTVFANVQPVTTQTLAMISEFNYSTQIGTSGRLLFPTGYISGMQLNQSASSDALDIGAGICTDVSGTLNIINATTLARKTIGAFSVGASSGARMGAAVISSNAWYAWYALLGSSGAVDFGFDLIFPPNVPTTTAAFPVYRYIGARKTSAVATWVAAAQFGDEVYLDNPLLEFSTASPGTAASTQTLAGVPKGVRVKPILSIDLSLNSGNAGTTVAGSVYISSLDNSNLAPSFSISPLGTLAVYHNGFGTANTDSHSQGVFSNIWTNSSAAFRWRCVSTGTFGGAGPAFGLAMATLGWIDPRGKPIT